MAISYKSQASKFLAKVPGENVFRCHDSCVMGDMAELAKALKTMTDETYYYHANAVKNDFANWVNDVIGDKEFAGSLRKATNRMQAANMVSDRIVYLNKQAARTNTGKL